MRFRYGVLAGMAVALLLSACAAAPAPVSEPAPVAETPGAPKAEMDKAKESRAYILENGLDAYAPEPYKRAEERFTAAQAAYGKDNDVARAELAATVPLYDQTIAEGTAKKLEAKRAAATAARAKADAEKAQVAAKEPYAAGDAAVKQAETDAKAGKLAAAVTGFEAAEKSFLDSASLAADRRSRARAALDKAEAALGETGQVMKDLQDEMAAGEGGAQ